jgi:alpha-L-rhamnosidase
VRQLGYRIRFEPGWDSGRVSSSESVLVEYGGPALWSGQRVVWRVRVWTDLGGSEWSEPDVFELGLLTADDWSARWVAPFESAALTAGARPAMLLRGEFEVPEAAVVRARLYATAHGVRGGEPSPTNATCGTRAFTGASGSCLEMS